MKVFKVFSPSSKTEVTSLALHTGETVILCIATDNVSCGYGTNACTVHTSGVGTGAVLVDQTEAGATVQGLLAGSAELTVSCASGSIVIPVTVAEGPYVTITATSGGQNSSIICPPNTKVTLTATTSLVGSSVRYVWYKKLTATGSYIKAIGPTTLASYNTTIQGYYKVVVSKGTLSAESDPILVTKITKPTAKVASIKDTIAVLIDPKVNSNLKVKFTVKQSQSPNQTLVPMSDFAPLSSSYVMVIPSVQKPATCNGKSCAVKVYTTVLSQEGCEIALSPLSATLTF